MFQLDKPTVSFRQSVLTHWYISPSLLQIPRHPGQEAATQVRASERQVGRAVTDVPIKGKGSIRVWCTEAGGDARVRLDVADQQATGTHSSRELRTQVRVSRG